MTKINFRHEEKLLDYFYFHPDHLGSSSYITNLDGAVSQHMEYLPFGETMVDEHLNSRNSPFKYNGKEFDEETGNYYYGARYYDPKWSIWVSVDPLAELQPDKTPYHYCSNNPINRTDPTGMLDGDYYTTEGKYLGSDGIDDDKTYVADSKNKNGTFNNARDLNISHSEFQKASNIIKHESSGNASESLWIAHTSNNAKGEKNIGGKQDSVYDQLTSSGYSSVSSSVKNTELGTSDSSNGANNARAGLISVLNGGTDPTGGAVLWDGTDFLSKGFAHNKFKEYKNLTMTRGAFDSFSQGAKNYDGTTPHSDFTSNHIFSGKGWMPNGGNFSAPKQGTRKAYYDISSAGSKGATIFWKINQ